jgi:hypothetical protein
VEQKGCIGGSGGIMVELAQEKKKFRVGKKAGDVAHCARLAGERRKKVRPRRVAEVGWGGWMSWS